ncbi:MAG: protein kinase [Candidatus Obscuribacterales bacterium]
MNPGRAGSFTQWIFRADTCDCDRPYSATISAQGEILAQTIDSMADLIDSQIEREIEEPSVELPPGQFPEERYKPIAELSSRVGSGVYLCRDLLLNKRVVVKIQHLSDPEQIRIFQQEAKATSKINHPNVVSVLDFGATTNGAPYMVMEHVSGVSLDRLLEQEPGSSLSPEHALKILSDISSALEFAHSAGIYHRDLKPGNIIVFDQGGVPGARLIDFGLALVTGEAGPGSAYPGKRVVGTPAYMAPEQVTEGQYDARSEIYSLGCILFELLSGSVPFPGNTTLDTIYRHALEQAVIPESLPADLQAILERCLDKDPEKRFQSVTELVAALERIEPLPESDSVSESDSETKPAQESKSGTKSLLGPRKVGIAMTLLLLPVCLGLYLMLQPHTIKNGKHARSGQNMAVVSYPQSIDDLEKKMRSRLSAARVRENFRKDGSVRAINWEAQPYNDDSLKGIADLPLENLNLSFTQVTDRGIDTIAGIKTLHRLDLEGLALKPDSIRKLSKLPELYIISLGRGPVGDEIFDALSKIQSLEVIRLSACNGVAGKGIASLNDLPNLRNLSLNGTRVDYRYMTDLDAPTIHALYLGNTGLEDKDVPFILHMTSLRRLAADDNPLSGAGLWKLRRLRRLKILTLSHCPNIDMADLERFRSWRPACSVKTDGKPGLTDLIND